jgi:hypothetical protein
MWGGFVVALECAGEFFRLDPRPVFPHFGESLSALKRKRNVFSKEDLIANFTLVYEGCCIDVIAPICFLCISDLLAGII